MPLYFAFGSNMQTSRLEERVGKVIALGKGQLDGWLFSINKKGADGTAKANMQKQMKERIHGVIFRLSEDQIKALDVYEKGYERIKVLVADQNGEPAVCATYTSTQFIEDQRPTKEYMSFILEGATTHELPEKWIEKLSAMETKD
jgi:AIG2-like family